MKEKTYTIVFVALLLATALEVLIINMNLTRSIVIQGIIALTLLKAFLIALFYMHIKYEWRSVSIFTLPALALILALTIAILIG